MTCMLSLSFPLSQSFTMIGAADIGNCMSENGDFDELAGITPRAISELFRLLNERTAQIDFVVEVQMFQLYRDGLDDLLKEAKKPNKKEANNGEDDKKPPPLKITLAEHSPTGLVFVSVFVIGDLARVHFSLCRFLFQSRLLISFLFLLCCVIIIHYTGGGSTDADGNYSRRCYVHFRQR